MTREKIISIAGYIRVSGIHQAKTGGSLPNQEKMIRSYAKAHGYHIYKIYSDKGISGSRNDRPALTEMKKDSRENVFQRVIFTHLDRFGRSASDTLSNYVYFEELGISLYSITEGMDTSTPIGKLFRTVLAALSEMETEQIRERMLVGRIERLRKGLGQPTRLYGYSWNKEKKAFELIPEEAFIYKRIVNDYLVKGKSQDEIAVGLNNEGIKSKFNKGWSQAIVGRLLKNPAYKGKWVYTILWERFKVDIPPLIEDKKWQEIQRRIRENQCNGHAADDNNQYFVLRKLLQCGECQSGIYPYVHRKRKVCPRYYACRSARPHKRDLLTGKRVCNLPYIPTIDLEDCVHKRMTEYFRLPENVLRLQNNKIDPAHKDAIQADLGRMKKRLRLLLRKRKEYVELSKEKSIDRKDLLRRGMDLESSIKYLRVQISKNTNELRLTRVREEELRKLPDARSPLKTLEGKIEQTLSTMTRAEIHGLYQAAFGERKLTVSKLSPLEDGSKAAVPLWLVKGVDEMNFDAAAQYLILKILSQKEI